MILDFTTLSDLQIKLYLNFLNPELFNSGKIERYIISGKCTKIKIEHNDRITIEPAKIIFEPRNGNSRVLLTIENLQNCVNLFNELIQNN